MRYQLARFSLATFTASTLFGFHSPWDSFVEAEKTVPSEPQGDINICPKEMPSFFSNPMGKKEKNVNEKPIQSCGNCGEDAYFFTNKESFISLGVADGVGGWVNQGVDPSALSKKVMEGAKNALNKEYVSPKEALSISFKEAEKSRDTNPGGTTACIISLDKKKGLLSAANLGDSGFLIIRDGTVIFKSKEQQHFFNAPYQFSIYPSNMRVTPGSILNTADDAAVMDGELQHGDIIILASDGLFDNMFQDEIVRYSNSILERIYARFPDYKDTLKEMYQSQEKIIPQMNPSILDFVQETMHDFAKGLTEESAKLSFNMYRKSPFAVNARRIGYDFMGGKVDDITILVGYVVGEDLTLNKSRL
ncbi:protein serine/threonine phosphatase 2C [Rozella allomycis CSF55]|uniref:Protein phosphatase n=1 Tax=Rozella allomycis (strain CSF55) TaxID=988480 RepID=A0A4P9YDU6_ROZAC|nr:protein serine/threonine phosphatase 2C [Rozella allomycis CSF55]